MSRCTFFLKDCVEKGKLLNLNLCPDLITQMMGFKINTGSELGKISVSLT